jgi:predicted regulator of Ras-like GTPase activity (Roadblock/LC7/MglB family)
VAASRARLAMFVDGGGFIVTRHGDEGEMDLATLGALAANSFAATQAIAKIIHEDSVTSLYQEGVQNSLLILSVEDFGFLAAVFPSQIGVGSVKFYSQDAIGRIGQQLAAARSRDPAGGLDLAAINLGDTGPFFRRRAI